MFIKDEDWTSARNLAREHEPRSVLLFVMIVCGGGGGCC